MEKHKESTKLNKLTQMVPLMKKHWHWENTRKTQNGAYYEKVLALTYTDFIEQAIIEGSPFVKFNNCLKPDSCLFQADSSKLF